LFPLWNSMSSRSNVRNVTSGVDQPEVQPPWSIILPNPPKGLAVGASGKFARLVLPELAARGITMGNGRVALTNGAV
jgi:hypothetical protein